MAKDQQRFSISVLATDLDGTFFPLATHDENASDLDRIGALLRDHDIDLFYVTGRSYPHVIKGIVQHSPPLPSTIICDVGTTIMHRHRDDTADVSDQFILDTDYQTHLRDILGHWSNQRIQQTLTEADRRIIPQSDEHQSELKTSFHYPPADRSEIASVVEQLIDRNEIPVSITISVDPFTDQGLLDLLPAGANKGYALRWWLTQQTIDPLAVVFAGDTGNDTAAMNCGVRGILVANADDQLRTAAKNHHRGTDNTLYQSNTRATSGVLEGLRHYLQTS